MNKGKFIFNPEDFQDSIVKKMEDISKEMDATYKEAVNLMKNDIENYKGWQGKQKKELLAFMDLITQFHKDLSSGKESPTDTFYDTISKFPDTVNGYVDESKSYKNLQGAFK